MMNKPLLTRARLLAIHRKLDAMAGSDDEWIPASESVPFQWYPSRGIPKLVLYTTKWHWIQRAISRPLPSTCIVARPGRLPNDLAHGLVTYALRNGARIAFVGDLDPFDLLIYASLHTAQTRRYRLEYRGVDSLWLSRCEQAAQRKGAEIPFLRQDALEVACWDSLRGAGWNSVIGAEATELLDSGRKLELEGASGAAFFGAQFERRVANRLFL
jgi:hypothetical protein